MPCTVHCLISEKEQLGPLMQRIARAGIAHEQVTVVWRDEAVRGADGAPALLAWCVFVMPATWWWQLALDTGDRACSAAPRGGPRTPASVMSAIELAARRADRSAG